MNPSSTQHLFETALQHHRAGRLEQARALYGEILAREPGHAGARGGLGVLAFVAGQYDAAAGLLGQAIAGSPGTADFHLNLGLVELARGRVPQAVAANQEGVRLLPESAAAHFNLANALVAARRVQEAIAEYGTALRLQPGYVQALHNLGTTLHAAGQLEDAAATFRELLRLRPDQAEAHNNLGGVLYAMGQIEPALASLRQAIALNPQLAEAHLRLGNALYEQGQLDEAIAAYRKSLACRPDSPQTHSNLVYAMHFLAGNDAQAMAQEHRLWNRQFAEPLRHQIQPHANERDPERRLRIGYVSPDFRTHPVGRFLLPLFSQHDKTAVEVVAYAQVPRPDAVTQQLRACTDVWRDWVGVSDAQAAEMVRADRIDILVDLSMHMAHNRLLVFARKPAPVQVTYLAYCSTTGLATMDYRLSDPYLDPPGLDESIYSERTVRLPESYWCYPPYVPLPEVGALPALGRGGVTFGCLNNFCKVNEVVLGLWARILHGVPGSQLLLYAPVGAGRQRAQGFLQGAGIDPGRVQFTGTLPPLEYFPLYQQIDVALDTFPYGGGTTTCDALSMGVPVVSLKGSTAVGRAGCSILSNLGHGELVAQTPEQYVQIAERLAGDLGRLGALRASLRQELARSPLCDGPRFARNVESAYRVMWRAWCAAPH